MRLRLALAAASTVLLAATHHASATDGADPAPVEVEERLRPAVEKGRVALTLSPGRDRAAAWEKGGDGLFRLVVDEVPAGPPSEEAHHAVFSPDGRHLAWSALRGGRRVLVVDGEERGPLDGLLLEKGLLAPLPRLKVAEDGRTVAWVACGGAPRRCTAQIHGTTPGRAFDSISRLWLSGGAAPRLAYVGEKGEGWALVVGGRETPLPVKRRFNDPATKLPPIEGFLFSADGKRDVFVGRATVAPAGVKSVVGGKDVPVVLEEWPVVFVDGGPAEPPGIDPVATRGLGLPVFSPDGSRLAWVVLGASTKEGFFSGTEATVRGAVVVDGKGSETWAGEATKAGSQGDECRGEASPVRSPTVVPAFVGGIHPCWAGVSSPVFSPDSKQVAWAARIGARSYAVIRDGKAVSGPPLTALLGAPVFSASGKLAWAGRGNGELLVIVDGEVLYREPDRAGSFVQDLTFSPDGAHLAFFTGTGDPRGKAPRRVVRDGVAGPTEMMQPPRSEAESAYLSLGSSDDRRPRPGPLRFSDDGAHLAWIRSRLDRILGESVVLDGKPGPGYAFVDPASLKFGPDGRVSYRAFRARGSFDVTQPRTPVAPTP